MPITPGLPPRRVTSTQPFGDIPTDLIETVEAHKLAELAEKISDLGLSLMTQHVGDEQHFAELVHEFRVGVGAFWLYLWRHIDIDIDRAYRVSESFWKCLGISLFTRRLHPQKYYRLCTTLARGTYPTLITQLANIPGAGGFTRDRMLQEWKKDSWRQHVDQIWKTKNDIIQKEKEYREAANIILQVGIGWGGMVAGIAGIALGFVGLVLSFASPINTITPPSSAMPPIAHAVTMPTVSPTSSPVTKAATQAAN